MKYKIVLFFCFTFNLLALESAGAITWELSKDLTKEKPIVLDSKVYKYAYKEIDCEVEAPVKNPFKHKNKEWLRTLKCVKNGIEASIVIGCTPGGEDQGQSFTINELKGLGLATPYLGCKP